MKKRLIFSLLVLLSSYGFGQVKLSGRFMDGNGRLVPYVNVTAFVGDSLVAGTLAGDSGAFTLDLPGGTYTLRASLFGKELYERKLVLRHALDLGIIQVKAGLQLGEVAVTGQKKLVEKKVDRLVFNVENALAASGGDALDALKITPGLRVESDKISMIGKGSLRVMVDGRMLPLSGEDLTNYLQSISADDIKSIEVITTPPAKYEAEGDSGLINIIYKKGRRDAWNADLRSSYFQTTYPAYTLGGTFSYRKNNWSLLFDMNAAAGNWGGVEKSQLFYADQTWVSEMRRKNKRDHLSARIALDYKLSEKATIGFQYLGSLRDPDIRDKNTIDIYSPSGALDSLIETQGFNDRLRDNHSLNLHYLVKLDTTGKTLSVDLDYFKHHALQNRNFVSQDYLPDGQATQHKMAADNNGKQHIYNYSARLDVVYPTKWVKLSYGAKLSFTKNKNAADFFNTTSGTPLLDPSKSDRFQYKENTQALYCSASKKLSRKWQSKLGLRLENTQTQGISKAGTHRDDYAELFPTFYLTYNANADHGFSLSYAKRIKRPAYWELNPFRWYMSSVSYAEGNPFLQPSFTDNFELSHSWKGKLISSASLRVTHNGFGQVPIVDPVTKEQALKRKNYYTGYEYSLSESYHFKLNGWWRSYNQAYLYYTRFEFDRKRVAISEQNGLGSYVSTNNTFLFNSAHTLQGALNFWYAPPLKSGLYAVRQHYSLDLAVKALLLDKNLQIALSLNDLFKTSSPDYIDYPNGVERISNIYHDNRHIKLSLKYRFGNSDIKVKKRDFGNREEKRRAGS